MCCSPSGHNKWIARQIVRVGFGLALIFTGISHYRGAADFAASVGNGLGPDWLVGIGTVWGYVLPLLLIIGGISLTLNLLTNIGTWATGLALASIPAGLMLKSAVSGISLGDTMPPAMNAYVWIIVFLLVIKGTGKGMCSSACGAGCADGCACGSANCDCGTGSACPVCGNSPCTCMVAKKPMAKPAMKSSMPAVAKSMPKKPVMKKKAPVKKAMPKSI